MTRHYPDLGSASDWSCCVGNLIQPIRSANQIWEVTLHQYGICALVSQTSFRRETSGSIANCRLFSQAKHNPESKKHQGCLWILGCGCGFGEVFLGSETCFGFWGSVFGFRDVFWILRSVFGFWELFLDSGKCFWILGRVLDSGKCFEPPLLLALITPHPDQRFQNIFSLIYKNVTIPYVLYLLEKWFATYFELALSTKLCTTSLFRVRLVIG